VALGFVMTLGSHLVDRMALRSAQGGQRRAGRPRSKRYSTGLHATGISRYPSAVFSTWATDGNG
jgi:hypothetical protein